MTSPQLEDGFIRIANELFEAILAHGFSQRQLLVLLAIVRKTYGFGKKEDDMSASQIGDLCGIKRNHVTETIGQLVEFNVLTRRAGNYGLILGVNKSYDKWAKSGQSDSPKSGLCPKLGLVPNRDKTSPESGQVDSPKSGHTKENLPKETQKKSLRQERTFEGWLADCKEAKQRPIPEDDPVFKYADELKIPHDYIRFTWVEFKRKYAGSGKKYKNWNRHFQNAVRENWYGIWFEKDGEWILTTRGKQIKIELKDAA